MHRIHQRRAGVQHVINHDYILFLKLGGRQGALRGSCGGFPFIDRNFGQGDTARKDALQAVVEPLCQSKPGLADAD